MEHECKSILLPSRKTRRPGPSPSRSSSGRHAGPAARFTRMAATPKPAPSACIGTASPTVHWRVLVGVLRQNRGTPPRSSVALRPSRRSARLRCAIDAALLARARRRQHRQVGHRLHPQARPRRRSCRRREPAADRLGRQGRLHDQPLGRQSRSSGPWPSSASPRSSPCSPEPTPARRPPSVQATRDEWAETIGEWRDRTASLPRYTPAGRRIAICPATYTDATCKSCGACARPRDAVIGFPAHGGWRQVEAATAARDVPPGHSWAFRDHRTMAEIIAAETKQPDAFTLQISRSAGSRRQKLSPAQMTPTPRLAACRAGFCVLGPVFPR